jgi:signal transduction histidine kinase
MNDVQQYQIAETIFNGYSMFILCLLLYKLFLSKLSKKKIYLLIAIFSVVESIILYGFGFYIDFFRASIFGIIVPLPYYYFSTYFLMGLLFSLFLDGKIIGKISICLFFIALQLTVNPISGSLVRPFYENSENAAFTVVNHVLLTLIILFVYRHMNAIKEGPPIKYVLGIITVSITTIFILIYLSYEFINYIVSALTSALFSIALGTTNLSMLYISDMLFKSNQENIKLTDYLHRAELNHMQMMETQNMINIVRTARHEMKNMIFVMKSLLEKEEYGELQAYFNRFGEALQLIKIETFCGNSILDAILNRKNMEAYENKIPMIIKAVVPEHLPIDSVYLSTVLFNSIDNAIEASLGMKKPEIHIDIHIIKRYLLITIRNRVDSDILKENPHLHTTKKIKEQHGIGIKVMRNMIRQNNGILQFSMENDFFCVSMMLLLNDSSITKNEKELINVI